jgi:hypothetical protein
VIAGLGRGGLWRSVGREGTRRGGNKVQRAKFTGRHDGRVGERPWHSLAAKDTSHSIGEDWRL